MVRNTSQNLQGMTGGTASLSRMFQNTQFRGEEREETGGCCSDKSMRCLLNLRKVFLVSVGCFLNWRQSQQFSTSGTFKGPPSFLQWPSIALCPSITQLSGNVISPDIHQKFSLIQFNTYLLIACFRHHNYASIFLIKKKEPPNNQNRWPSLLLKLRILPCRTRISLILSLFLFIYFILLYTQFQQVWLSDSQVLHRRREGTGQSVLFLQENALIQPKEQQIVHKCRNRDLFNRRHKSSESTALWSHFCVDTTFPCTL